MYLGNSEMKENETYFFPLLPVWKKRANDNNDEDLFEKIKELESFPSIKILRNDDLYDFPMEANNVISHGAYKIIYYGLQSSEYILALRDIDSEEKDDVGRSIPFLIALVGEAEDKVVLDKLCSYMVNNMDAVNGFMSHLFKYDWKKNGIYFRLHDFTQWINEVIETASDKIKTLKQEYVIDMSDNKAFVLIPDGLNLELAKKEQALHDKEVCGILVKEIKLSEEQEGGTDGEDESEDENEDDGGNHDVVVKPDDDTYKSKLKMIAIAAVAIVVLGIILAIIF